MSCMTSGALAAIESIHVVHSRLILLDAQLLFYINLTLLFALRLWRCMKYGRIGTIRYYVLLFKTALAGAAAMSVKWTAFFSLLLVATVCSLGVMVLSKRMPLLHCILAGTAAFAFYLVPWYLQMSTCFISTPSMGKRMSERFQKLQFMGTSQKNFFERTFELHKAQFYAMRNVKTRHMWESRWDEWLQGKGGILYYISLTEETEMSKAMTRIVSLHQNPTIRLVIYVTVLTTMILLIVSWRYRHLRIRRDYLKDVSSRGLFLLVGYWLNILPFSLVKRCYFLYHYLPALTFAHLLTGFMVDKLPIFIRIWVVGAIVSAAGFDFWYWSEFIYCVPTAKTAFDLAGRGWHNTTMNH